MSPNQTEILQKFYSPEVDYRPSTVESNDSKVETKGYPTELTGQMGSEAVSAAEADRPNIPTEKPKTSEAPTSERAATIAAGLTARLLALRGRVTGQSGINR